MEHSSEIRLAIIMRLCGISFRQDSHLMPWAFLKLAENLNLNPIYFNRSYFVCDVPMFVQQHFYFEVIDNIALRATCDVANSEGFRIFIRDSIKLGRTNIRLHRLLDWPDYFEQITKCVLLCESIYRDYFKIGFDEYELMALKFITKNQLQGFHVYVSNE